jgi:hypothetical protein
MSSKTRVLLGLALAAGLVVAGWPSAGYARVDCDPNKDYAVNPAAGAWMIIVQAYSGEIAQDQARKLVIELRSKFDLPAYTFNRGKEERDKQDEEMRHRRQQQEQFLKERGLVADMPFRMKHVRIEDQYAVLIGGYKDMDTAARDLKRIKKLPAPSKELSDSVGIATPEKGGANIERAYINPFLTAFVVPNPTVPHEKPKDEPDPLLKELNANETYSLFKSPKQWTLVVKQFSGANQVVQKSAPLKMLDTLLGRGGPDTLNASAMQAHEIVRVLRDHMKVESYVLHTRYGSIVSIGSYDSQDDPRLLQNKQLFGNFQMKDGHGMSVMKFDPLPTPMKVPEVR